MYKFVCSVEFYDGCYFRLLVSSDSYALAVSDLFNYLVSHNLVSHEDPSCRIREIIVNFDPDFEEGDL